MEKGIGETKGGISNENEKKDTRSAMLRKHFAQSIKKGKWSKKKNVINGQSKISQGEGTWYMTFP